jgi:Cu(I)/Ag(I) efflux system membrane protein CusA/SilA
VEEIAIKIIIWFPLRISVLFKWVGFTSGDFDANGEEVVGGIVVMRYGENADKVIDAVKLK